VLFSRIYTMTLNSEDAKTTQKYYDIIKSENDPRLYRFIELANKIKVLLISDASADKSAASVDVHIGKSSLFPY